MHAFDVLGDPVRRRVVELLAEGERSAGDLTAHLQAEFGITQPAVSRHLRVLRETGFATSEARAQRRLYRLQPEPLAEVDAWLGRYRRLWPQALDALDPELRHGGLHHLELWVADLQAALPPWRWLLGRLGWVPMRTWPAGASWRFDEAYLVLESGPDVARGGHERTRPGLNHLAFHAGSRAELDALVAQATGHGWRLLFADRHPYAGGPEHYAAYLENADGFEVELVAETAPEQPVTAGSASA